MPVFEDLTGKKIGYLTVLHRAPDWVQPSGQHKRMWHCICECGKECDVRASDIKSGNTTSCGCQSSRKRSVGLEDLTGKQFGDFVVVKRAPNKMTPSGQPTRVWRCRCINCGLERDIRASQLKKFSGKCSCNKTEESKRKKKEYIDIGRDLSGYIFGELMVERYDVTINKRRYWLCNCKCGKTNISVEEYRLLSGKKKSCGCQEKKKSRERRLDKIANSENSLLFLNHKLALEWHPTQNDELKPEMVTPNCNIKVWWLGECGHEWEATVGARSRGSGCPICSNRRRLKGFNDIRTLYPELLSEWDYEKNDVLPEDVSSLNYLAWWKCNLGHSYDMKISLRVGKQECGCPYCRGKRVLKGFNDLATTHPYILSEWDYEKNEIRPDKVSYGSAKKVWWKCRKGHSFEQSIVYKVKSELESTCPYCSHQKLMKGYNDLATTHAYILDEWDYEKNDILPTQIGVGTHKKIWWKCPFGHSYQTYPSNRCGKQHTGCPICDKENHTSFPEQAVLYYVKKYFTDAINSDKERIGMELDIYIPQLDTAIEYDGKTWHNNNSYEIKKNKVCKQKNVLLIRIREDGLKLYDDCVCLVRKDTRSNESLSKVIDELLQMIDGNIETDVDVDRDSAFIYSSYIETRKAKSLASVFPHIAKEWHPTKNGQLTSMMVAPMANKKVWWLGECGHEYQMGVGTRANQNCGCPYCSGKRILKGFNDFETWCKENDMTLLEEWDYMRNSILPSEVTKSSDKLIYWKCSKCSNVWRTKVDSRTRMKTGCPKCASYYRNAKPVINLDTNTIYESMLEAEKELNINRNCIGNVCRGKQKTAGGYRWAYYEG